MKVIQQIFAGLGIIFVSSSTVPLWAQGSAARSALPTDFADCDTLERENRLVEAMYSNQWSQCHNNVSCSPMTCNGWREAAECRNIRLYTYGTCLSMLEAYCRFQNEASEASTECYGKVRRYKELQEIWDAADEERDETERFLSRVRDGAVEIGDRVLQRPADKIFASGAKATLATFSDARRKLNAELDRWQLSGDNMAIYGRLQATVSIRDARQDRLFLLDLEPALMRADKLTGKTVIGGLRDLNTEYEQNRISRLWSMERAGDARAAYVLGSLLIDSGDPFPHLLQSAVLGYPPAAHLLGAHFVDRGFAERGVSWLALAKKLGSAPAGIVLSKLDKSSQEGAQQKSPLVGSAPAPT